LHGGLQLLATAGHVYTCKAGARHEAESVYGMSGYWQEAVCFTVGCAADVEGGEEKLVRWHNQLN
jgi:hypothetical protein